MNILNLIKRKKKGYTERVRRDIRAKLRQRIKNDPTGLAGNAKLREYAKRQGWIEEK